MENWGSTGSSDRKTPPTVGFEMPGSMYDDFSPEPVLKDIAPGFYSSSAAAIQGVEQASGKAAAMGSSGSAKGGERSSRITLALKYTASPDPSARAKQRKDLVDKYVRQEIEPLLATAMSYLLLKVCVRQGGG